MLEIYRRTANEHLDKNTIGLLQTFIDGVNSVMSAIGCNKYTAWEPTDIDGYFGIRIFPLPFFNASTSITFESALRIKDCSPFLMHCVVTKDID